MLHVPEGIQSVLPHVRHFLHKALSYAERQVFADPIAHEL